jgi:hypothetical protein
MGIIVEWKKIVGTRWGNDSGRGKFEYLYITKYYFAWMEVVIQDLPTLSSHENEKFIDDFTEK